MPAEAAMSWCRRLLLPSVQDARVQCHNNFAVTFYSINIKKMCRLVLTWCK